MRNHKMAYDLNAILSAVDVITKEQEACWHESRTHSPQRLLKTNQVMVVAMYITWNQSIITNISGTQQLTYHSSKTLQQMSLHKLPSQLGCTPSTAWNNGDPPTFQPQKASCFTGGNMWHMESMTNRNKSRAPHLFVFGILMTLFLKFSFLLYDTDNTH